MNLADNVDIGVQTVVTGRGCIIGQSGSGKSFLVGVVAEELCRSKMPFCVIDTEGEYRSLKSMTNIIVVGENGDVNSDVDFSKLFRVSIENDIPVVIDVSEAIDSRELVYSALESLYALENKMRKPYLVILEEADKFAPQIVSKGINVIEEISVRGRKRGIGLLIATQRPANISKNVLSQCSYGFIGKLTIENDLNAIKILFEDRSKLVAITRLATGEFVSFGTGAEEKFKVKGRVVKHVGMTPEVESYKPLSSRFSLLVKKLKGDSRPKVQRRAKRESMEILAMSKSFSEDGAREFAEKIAKKRFAIFGNVTEKIESIELQYLPIGVCTFRTPTGKRNEYLEHSIMLYGKRNVVVMKKGVSFAALETVHDGAHKKYLDQNDFKTGDESASKENVLKGAISEKDASACLKKLSPNAFLTEFQLLHIPVYKITLKKGNKVRVFNMDAIYGKEMEVPK